MLTYHFRDKDEILLALYERLVGRWQATFEDVITDDVSLEDQVARVVAEVYRRADEERGLVLLLVHYLSETPDHPEVAQRLREFFAGMRTRAGSTLAGNIAGRMGRDPETVAGVFQTVVLGALFGRAMLGLDVPAADLERRRLGYLTGGSPVPWDGAAVHAPPG